VPKNAILRVFERNLITKEVENNRILIQVIYEATKKNTQAEHGKSL